MDQNHLPPPHFSHSAFFFLERNRSISKLNGYSWQPLNSEIQTQSLLWWQLGTKQAKSVFPDLSKERNQGRSIEEVCHVHRKKKSISERQKGRGRRKLRVT
jgi:hypothetical protein